MIDEKRISQIKDQLELISTAMRGGTEDKTMHQNPRRNTHGTN
jgi:hypothetical protein